MSIKATLLHASIAAGMTRDIPVQRLQLYFVANFKLGSRNKIDDFQRCIETGVADGFWSQPRPGSGEYCLTEKGGEEAKGVGLTEVTPAPAPQQEPRFELSGSIAGTPITMRRLGTKCFEVTIGEERYSKSVDAIRCLRKIDSTIEVQDAVSKSQATALYNLAVERRFVGHWFE